MYIWFYIKTSLGFSRCLHCCNPWRSALSGHAASGLLSRAEVSAVRWAELLPLPWLHVPDLRGGQWKMNVAQECTLWSDIKFNTSIPGWIPSKLGVPLPESPVITSTLILFQGHDVPFQTGEVIQGNFRLLTQTLIPWLGNSRVPLHTILMPSLFT